MILRRMEINTNRFDINKVVIWTFITSVILYIGVSTYLGRNVMKEIEIRGHSQIANFYYYKSYPKSKNYYFVFYYLGYKKKCDIIRAPMGFSKNIGKFYYVKYLPKYPDLIIVNFNEEITDTKAILEAGFVKEDIKLYLTDTKNKYE